MNITGNANATLALPKGTITRDYQGTKTTIDLAFTTNEVTERLIEHFAAVFKSVQSVRFLTKISLATMRRILSSLEQQ